MNQGVTNKANKTVCKSFYTFIYKKILSWGCSDYFLFYDLTTLLLWFSFFFLFLPQPVLMFCFVLFCFFSVSGTLPKCINPEALLPDRHIAPFHVVYLFCLHFAFSYLKVN